MPLSECFFLAQPFRCSLSSPQLYQDSARCRSQRISVLHSRLTATQSHPAALNACDKSSFFAATASNSSLMETCFLTALYVSAHFSVGFLRNNR
ncbi:hypothetical protein T01_11998 [Trichinella spiralis]|uniref:Uncharacterized protein n=1 Tax=Trichinella spiralis TaxID=6334 RepID=A0A0V1BTY0_TRISP|nr:hypothetical protein T01_11998 [Trichinella spiralis]